MKEFSIMILVLAVVAGAGWFVYNSSNSENEALNKANEIIVDLQDQVKALESAASANVDPAVQLDAAAKAGLTERPNWQLQKIMERGGDGSIFYQMEGSTRKDSGVTTVGPHGFSWRSTTDDALTAANKRRNGLSASPQASAE